MNISDGAIATSIGIIVTAAGWLAKNIFSLGRRVGEVEATLSGETGVVRSMKKLIDELAELEKLCPGKDTIADLKSAIDKKENKEAADLKMEKVLADIGALGDLVSGKIKGIRRELKLVQDE